MKDKYLILIGLFIFCLNISGCAVVLQKGRRSDIEKIQELKKKLTDLELAKRLLEEKLKEEIKKKEITVTMEKKKLVITMLAKILFDPGKAVLKKSALKVLDKVSQILKEEVPEKCIEIRGHTDNQPIKYSGWKSNWELSCARALSVLHYLEEKGIFPHRMHAACFGEYKPVASNETEEGRRLNRRVEIVVLPEKAEEVKSEKEVLPAEPEPQELIENLK